MGSPGEDGEATPLVSVLVPAWNAGRSIGRALDSVLDDPTRDVQVVVVDDASTDDTAAVVAGIAARDRRVELLRAERNGGPSAARNLGLPHLRGRWITFLDADDRFLPGGFAALVAAAEGTDASAIVGQRIWSDGTRTWLTSLYDQPDIRLPGRKSLVTHPGLLFYASGTGKLFRRECTEGLGFDGRVLGDQPWTIRALLRAGGRIDVIPDTVYEWTRPAPGSADTSITARKHASAAMAAEAVRVAIGAFREVHDEAARVLADAADRDTIDRAYVERLMRADFSGPVRRALQTRDPGMDELFEAIASFVRSVPPTALAGAPSFWRVLAAPFHDWHRATPAARRSWVALVRSLPDSVLASAGGSLGPLARVELAVARRLPDRPANLLIRLTAVPFRVARAGYRRLNDR